MLLSNVKNIVSQNLKHLLNKNENFGVNVNVDNFLRDNGKEKVSSITLVRVVFMNKMMIDGVGVISPSFQRKIKYDALYHTFLIINKKFKVNKNEVLHISHIGTLGKKYETLDVPINKDITIFDWFNNTKKIMGVDKMIRYNVENNNCQNLVIEMLRANGVLNDEREKFIKQDTNDAISGLENKITPITDTARVLNPIKDLIIPNPGYTNPLDNTPFKIFNPLLGSF